MIDELQRRIVAFEKLGQFLSQFITPQPHINKNVDKNEFFFEAFKHQLQLASAHNAWFTIENMNYAFKTWSKLLTKDKLTAWFDSYTLVTTSPKKIAVIMAGNIPLVGFHDFLCVLLTGNTIIVKQSSNDKDLLPLLANYLMHVEPKFNNCIHFSDERITTFDAVIATGSNNTARYFEYYFGAKPHIIRKSRNSVAVLTGKETQEELEALGEDIFTYYGLGCRSVSKLFVPVDYNFDTFFQAIYHYKDIIDEIKYANNYDYNKAVYLMSLFKVLENGFLMLKEDKGYASPIATVFYEKYKSLKSLKKYLENDSDKIQCIVSKGFIENEVAFGATQKPKLHDYADEIDTIQFILSL